MKLVKMVSTAARFIVMIATVIIMLLLVADVILRRFFLSPIIGTAEYAQMLMVMILLGAASTALIDGHIKIELVYTKLPPRVQAIFDMITLALSFAISALITTRAFNECMIAARNKVKFLTVSVQKAPFFFIYSLGLFVLCLAIICLFIDAAGRLIKNEQ